jgi:branched-subunit amino acid aminotransferase/4-amino-4-deoxychorismate lyase
MLRESLMRDDPTGPATEHDHAPGGDRIDQVDPTDRRDRIAWVDGVFGGACSAYDHGLLSGLGLFETMGAVGGTLPLFARHLARLERSALRLGFAARSITAPPANLLAAAEELLARNGDDILRLTMTAGADETLGSPPSWTLTTRRRVPSDRPLRLFIAPTRRHRDDPLADLKCTSNAALVLLRRRARSLAADDALLLDPDGEVLETTTGNLFFLRGGMWCTPALSGAVLPGIARAALIEALSASRHPFLERDFSLGELLRSEALMVTNAVYGPRPAVLADGPPGPLSATAASSAADREAIAFLIAAWRQVAAAPSAEH